MPSSNITQDKRPFVMRDIMPAMAGNITNLLEHSHAYGSEVEWRDDREFSTTSGEMLSSTQLSDAVSREVFRWDPHAQTSVLHSTSIFENPKK
jgi:hypothetical protein